MCPKWPVKVTPDLIDLVSFTWPLSPSHNLSHLQSVAVMTSDVYHATMYMSSSDELKRQILFQLHTSYELLQWWEFNFSWHIPQIISKDTIHCTYDVSQQWAYIKCYLPYFDELSVLCSKALCHHTILSWLCSIIPVWTLLFSLSQLIVQCGSPMLIINS